MRLAAEYEAAEGRDLRGFLDFLAARAAADVDAAAATAIEGHDGVRIMTDPQRQGARVRRRRDPPARAAAAPQLAALRS